MTKGMLHVSAMFNKDFLKESRVEIAFEEESFSSGTL